MKKVTKKQKVLEHLFKHGTISSWEAIQNYNATRLSAIIYTLKSEGYQIWAEPIKMPEGGTYAVYHLEESV